ncbi:unnamed protein product [Miscanthus lutarioriparius]|uniref:Uncharacterized protein n=1 Tax=Miscanthus lutarioriparius TaxID=422564 RepID=A0A811PUM2_9POAL|nr:unnamed protein product [Miscanthus lutarioriparius]
MSSGSASGRRTRKPAWASTGWSAGWPRRSAQQQEHAPDHAKANQSTTTRTTSYVTAAAAFPNGMSEKTVEMETTSRSPLTQAATVAHGRPPAIPRYMAATRSARAKARPVPPSATPTHARSRSGGGLAGDTSSSGQNGSAIAGYSPDSSGTGDWTPPRFGVSTRTSSSRVAYT